MQNSESNREHLQDRTWGFIWQCDVKGQQGGLPKQQTLEQLPWACHWAPLVCKASKQSAQWTLLRTQHVGNTVVTWAGYRKEKTPHTPSQIMRNIQTGWKSQMNANTPKWPKRHINITNGQWHRDIPGRAATGPREAGKKPYLTMPH